MSHSSSENAPDLPQDLTIAEWLSRLMLHWELSASQLSRLIHVEETRLTQELEKNIDEARRGATIPAGLDCAPAFIRIYQLLSARHPRVEDQLKWLFTANPDFGGEKPIDVVASSRENLFWIAYYLASRQESSPVSP